MNIFPLVRVAARALTRPLPGTRVLEREHTRARFVFAALAIILITAPLFDAEALRWPLFWATAVAVGATAVASLVPAFWPALNRIGGLLIAAEITAHVAATGGAASPYDVFYGMLLVYATMFYGTRRLVTTTIVLVALWVAPHVLAAGTSPEAHWRDVAVEVAVWAVIAVVVHGLMQRIWDQSAALTASEERYRSLFLHNPNGVFSLDDQGRFTTMNAAGTRLLGVSLSRAIGQPFHPFIAVDELPAVEQRFQAVLAGTSHTYEVTVLDVRGRRIPTEITNVPIVVNGEVVGVHGIVRDLSENKALLERLEHQSLHDALTGLANRDLLEDRLHHALKASERGPGTVAVLMLDLDGFKAINDTHGHAAGDAVLVEIAHRMTVCLRPGDTVARLGGDEFAVVLPHAGEDAATQVARRLLAVVSAPVVIDEIHLTVGISIGVVTSSPGRGDGDRLLRDADQAMYEAKRGGRGRYVVSASASASASARSSEGGGADS